MEPVDPSTAREDQLGLWDWAPGPATPAYGAEPRDADVLDVACSRCGSKPQVLCRGVSSELRGAPLKRQHRERYAAAKAGRKAGRPAAATLAPVTVRTSATDPLRVDWVAGLPVGLTMAPGRRGRASYTGIHWQRSLASDLERLRFVERADVLVTLMEPHELATFGIADLPARAHAIGMRWLGLPIRDGGVPESTVRVQDLLLQLRGEVGRVVVHCLGGLGRSGLVVGCLLADLGWDAEEALDALRRARGPHCPETAKQVDYVRAWARWRQGGARPLG